MSDESLFTDSPSARLLRQEEAALIRALLVYVHSAEEIERSLSNCRVADMQDGGMGSIRFLNPEAVSFGKILVEAQYLDTDGVLVSIAVNSDKEGQLFELDFWKVDFSPLKRYPTPADLSSISTPR